jgi:hypothetical protein
MLVANNNTKVPLFTLFGSDMESHVLHNDKVNCRKCVQAMLRVCLKWQNIEWKAENLPMPIYGLE